MSKEIENGKNLFQNGRYCKNCGKVLFESYTKEYCVTCETQLLFDDVRDYIRSTEVNEYDVAKHFNIPVSLVQRWIKEGRIEYKEKEQKTLAVMFCERCGARVSFGTLCQKCLKEMNEQRKGYAVKRPDSEEENRMHYLE